MSIPALNAGMQGIATGLDNLRRDANDIAQAVNGDADNAVDVADSLIKLKLDQAQVRSSAKVVETMQDLLGNLVDEMA